MPEVQPSITALEAPVDFINSAPCGFLSFNDNGTILLVNDLLLNDLGYAREEIVDIHFDKLLSVAGRIFYQTHFFPLLKLRGSVEEIYLSLRTRAGEQIPMLVNASRHKAGDGFVNYCVMLSMRERRKFEDELISARKEVEEAARMKDEFLAMVSHELRTPLTAIVGWLHILKDNLDDSAVLDESVAVIERNAIMQTQLIEDLLDFSRIVSGKLRLDVGPVDLVEVVKNAIDVVRPAIEAKEIRLVTILDPNAGPVQGDASRLQQVIWNLLSNAVKFTPKRKKIRIELRRANSHAEIVIEDEGIGIDPEFLPYVFERFRQEDNTRTRRHGGLGLGLSITKEIVELHGGTIKASSAGQGAGSTFELHLPIPSVLASKSAKKLASDDSSTGSTGTAKSLQGIRVLIVDDIPESLEMVARILNKAGAETTRASRASEALEFASGSLPDILVADLGMPEMDGFELVRVIRASPKPLKDLPAIALSALVTDADRLRAMECGFQAFLSKPASPKELVLTILNLAKRE